MKRVLAHIAVRSERFAQEPMFRYLRDKSIDPEQRLCFMPMMAHFVFSFMDINKYILRNEALDSPLQRMINTHTYEDATHWPWWIRDMKNAGLDKTCSFTEAMLFVWSEATRRSRMLTYDIIAMASKATPNQLLAIVETVESTGNKFQGTTAEVCEEIENNQFSYLGHKHLSVESGHTMGTPEVMSYLEGIEFSDEELTETIAMVDKLFRGFTSFVAEMYEWVTTHNLPELQTRSFFRERANNRISRPLGTQEIPQHSSPMIPLRDLPQHSSPMMDLADLPPHGSTLRAHAELPQRGSAPKAHADPMHVDVSQQS
jgi:hypothetical protein